MTRTLDTPKCFGASNCVRVMAETDPELAAVLDAEYREFVISVMSKYRVANAP